MVSCLSINKHTPFNQKRDFLKNIQFISNMFSIDTARNKTKHKAADRGIVVVIIVDVVVDAVAVVVVVTCH